MVHVTTSDDIQEEVSAPVQPLSLWRRLVWRNRDAVGLEVVNETHAKYVLMSTVRAGLEQVSKVRNYLTNYIL